MFTMTEDIAEVSARLQERNIAENLRNLLDVKPSTEHRLLLVRHNSLMNDFFKGTISKADFDTVKIQIWESFFYFLDRLDRNFKDQFFHKITRDQTGSTGRKGVLFIAASPANIAKLQVDLEFSKIKESLEKGSERNRFELLLPLMAVTLEQFLNERHKLKPDFIHFSGHGMEEGLMFSTSNNLLKIIKTEILEEVFKDIGSYTECVVLNACYAAAQAKVISAQGTCVIGMNAPVSDPAAIYFSENFYLFLSNGQSVEEAFRNTRTLLLANFRKEAKIPEIWNDGMLLES